MTLLTSHDSDVQCIMAPEVKSLSASVLICVCCFCFLRIINEEGKVFLSFLFLNLEQLGLYKDIKFLFLSDILMNI